MHTGEALLRDGDYFGDPLNIAARLTALASGGQMIVSAVTAELLTGRMPPGVTLKDLGEHWLKGVARPHRVLQVVAPGLEHDFPLASPTAASSIHSVPQPLTSFIGRAHELSDCARLLHDARVLTLTGLGGTGKTRLALAVAERSKAVYRDGVFFVDLVPVADPDRVASSVAAALGIGEQPGRSMVESVCARLAHRQVLIVLDNCEHVLRAAAAFVTGLLASTRQVTVLATSSEPLGIAGEQVAPVATLGVARRAADKFENSDAGRLFLSRAPLAARPVSPGQADLQLVEAICSKLEGLPLAIELAAARLKVLSLQDIHDRLNDRFGLLRGLTTV